jgi:hypothetical protein
MVGVSRISSMVFGKEKLREFVRGSYDPLLEALGVSGDKRLVTLRGQKL